VFKKKKLRKISECKRDELKGSWKIKNVELHNLYSLPKIGAIK
jgi:hypothetical protein